MAQTSVQDRMNTGIVIRSSQKSKSFTRESGLTFKMVNIDLSISILLFQSMSHSAMTNPPPLVNMAVAYAAFKWGAINRSNNMTAQSSRLEALMYSNTWWWQFPVDFCFCVIHFGNYRSDRRVGAVKREKTGLVVCFSSPWNVLISVFYINDKKTWAALADTVKFISVDDPSHRLNNKQKYIIHTCLQISTADLGNLSLGILHYLRHLSHYTCQRMW